MLILLIRPSTGIRCFPRLYRGRSSRRSLDYGGSLSQWTVRYHWKRLGGWVVCGYRRRLIRRLSVAFGGICEALVKPPCIRVLTIGQVCHYLGSKNTHYNPANLSDGNETGDPSGFWSGGNINVNGIPDTYNQSRYAGRDDIEQGTSIMARRALSDGRSVAEQRGSGGVRHLSDGLLGLQTGSLFQLFAINGDFLYSLFDAPVLG